MRVCKDEITAPKPELAIVLPAVRIPLFFPLLASGFQIRVETGHRLRDVLCRQIGIDGDYLDSAIQTVFINGRAVDDIDREIVPVGVDIALSAAMPGLAGAVFRKGGALSAFRAGLTDTLSDAEKNCTFGDIQLKLFNKVAADLGVKFLAAGILTPDRAWKPFLARHCHAIAAIARTTLDHRPCDLSAYPAGLPDKGYLRLSVRPQRAITQP